MQKKIDVTNQPVFSLDALFAEEAEAADIPQVSSTAASAMKILMLRNQQSYINEINKLADICAQLLKQGTSVDSVVQAIKSGIADSYQQTLDKVTSEIGLGQFQLNHTNPQTVAGQSLEKHVKSMRRYKETPLIDIMEAITTDTLVQASAKFDADLGDIDFLNFKSRLVTL
ncbi:hypothetical protein [Legionella tucsonensis]|uniref:Uncharacterized protein n=1 Tax=Legionella tucsonensis TaxID=40335 RepID=A0A0W0ZTW3_9GAMM|nr:hypothetical protein [Legionella tucsonensis]KTD72621.1 hypothetical protein Ltuc_0468 [Legionella tucsonensis]